MNLEQLFAHYGYLALIFGSFADGTPIMLFGGFAAHRGWLVLVPCVILAGAVGNFLAAPAGSSAIRAAGRRRPRRAGRNGRRRWRGCARICSAGRHRSSWASASCPDWRWAG